MHKIWSMERITLWMPRIQIWILCSSRGKFGVLEKLEIYVVASSSHCISGILRHDSGNIWTHMNQATTERVDIRRYKWKGTCVRLWSYTSHCIKHSVLQEEQTHRYWLSFLGEKVLLGDIVTRFVQSNNQLAYIFTKSLAGPKTSYAFNKFGTYNLYAPA